MTTLKLAVLGILFVVTVVGFSSHVEARGRYGSIRVGGYTSHGKGSHYIGGYVRSCHGAACY